MSAKHAYVEPGAKHAEFVSLWYIQAGGGGWDGVGLGGGGG